MCVQNNKWWNIDWSNLIFCLKWQNRVRFIRACLYSFFGKTQSDSVKAELRLIKEIIHMFVFWLALQAAQSKHPVWTSQRDCRLYNCPQNLSVYVQTLNKCNLQPSIWWREEELNVPLASRSRWFESRNKGKKKMSQERVNKPPGLYTAARRLVSSGWHANNLPRETTRETKPARK